MTYRPLGKAQIHLSSALSGDSLVLLQAAAHDARGDGEVAVVAAKIQDAKVSIDWFGGGACPLGPARVSQLRK